MKIEVATFTAVRVEQKRQRDGPCVEAKFAATASPRAQTRGADCIILGSAAFRTAAPLAAAPGTNHITPPCRRLPPTYRILEPLARRKHPGGGACDTCKINVE